MGEDETVFTLTADSAVAKEVTPNLQLNIEQDTRFQSLMETALVNGKEGLDAKLDALEAFRTENPNDYDTYERESIWYNADGQADASIDLFYLKLDNEAFDEGSEILLEIGSEFSDPNEALTAMARSYTEAHFKPYWEKFSEYKDRFPEKVEKYRQSPVEHNKHWVDRDLYAKEKLSEETNDIAIAFHKAVIMQRLGTRAPHVSPASISADFYNEAAIYIGGTGEKLDDKLKKKLEEIKKMLFGEEETDGDSTQQKATP